jgi:hypothetical protein
MPRQQPIRVVVEHRRAGAGCGTTLAVLILIGLAIEYWYVALGILVLVVAIGLVVNAQQRKEELEKQRHRPGPRDPWLNEIAVALADLGLTEVARNTGGQLGGVSLEGDIGLQADRFLIYINLFAEAERARQAEIGLRATPKIRDAIASGATVVKADDRLIYVANGRGGVVDEFRLDEVMREAGKIALPPPLQAPVSTAPMSPTSAAMPPALQAPTASPDALEQLRKLGELRDAGVLNQAEFEAKKAGLLRRV